MDFVLEFERPLRELEQQIEELKQSDSVDISQEISALQQKVGQLSTEIYGGLSPWQRVQLSRHPSRPHTSDYIKSLIRDFHELRGDRRYSDDKAVIAGLGYLGDQKVAVVGIEKGRKTGEKIERNFGMAHPEGYRKALRVMELASRFDIPVITLVDTPGAYPGLGAEERGQAQAIAQSIEEMFTFDTPIVSVVIGEGGSGGALGVAIADHVAMLQYSVYSVISPESAASILWSDPKRAEDAANSLRLVPEQALEFKVIDAIIKEPVGGAHRDPSGAFKNVKVHLGSIIKKLRAQSSEERRILRYERFRRLGMETISNGQSKGDQE